jgi:hypothetical protein
MATIITSSYSSSFIVLGINFSSSFSSSVFKYNNPINLDNVFYYFKTKGQPFLPSNGNYKPGIKFISPNGLDIFWFYENETNRDSEFSTLASR